MKEVPKLREGSVVKILVDGSVILRHNLVSILMVDTRDGKNTVVIFKGRGTFAS